MSSFRSNSFGISATIAFAFVMPNSRYLRFFTTDPFRGSSHTQDKLFKNFKM
ncbi:hypothetical protein LEP1GSC073_0764 [Leptospira noguchii str. Cascata]|nr:hypothetical protein LEP1GSC072_4130 [Leptospira noguchii str. Bonito]EMS89426.1 hypothetical protein LEP1GSC073_0764 [Leptospira noguchii str. Cascata]